MHGGHRRRLAGCLAVAAIAAAGCGDDPDAAATLASLGEGVARVEVVWRDADGVRRSRAFGTAFRIGAQGELLTAQHVAANARTQREKLGRQTQAKLRAAFAPAGSGPGSDAAGTHSVEVEIAAEDRDADLALLRIVEPPGGAGLASGAGGSGSGAPRAGVARLAATPPRTDASIAVAGYPIGERNLVVRSGRLLDPGALSRALGNSESLPGWLEELLRDDAVLLADVETRLGNSGAPIYLAQTGEIVGLCSAILLRGTLAKSELIPLPQPPGDPITLIVAAHRIRSFLDASRAQAR